MVEASPLVPGNVAQNAHPTSPEPAIGRLSTSPTPLGSATPTGTSTIGTDLTILGQDITIISKNRLQFDGDIHGDVAAKDLIISADGSVIGNVSAERVDVHGGVKGAIRAMTVVLHPSAQVEGDILHKNLEVAEGALLEGRIRRPRDAEELKPNLDAKTLLSAGNGVRREIAA